MWDYQTNFVEGFKMMSFDCSPGNGQQQIMTPLPKMIDIQEENSYMKHIIMNFMLFHSAIRLSHQFNVKCQ